MTPPFGCAGEGIEGTEVGPRNDVDDGGGTDGGFASLMRLKSDIGVGVRVGLPRTPKNLLRIDFAYALNPDPMGRRGFLISFSSGQAF